MIKSLICWIRGHKPVKVGDQSILSVKDMFGNSIIDIELCERCKFLYWKGFLEELR